MGDGVLYWPMRFSIVRRATSVLPAPVGAQINMFSFVL
jgi:hypothetical protein